jgi:hypothetical protein
MVIDLLGKLLDIFNVQIRITDGKVKCSLGWPSKE